MYVYILHNRKYISDWEGWVLPTDPEINTSQQLCENWIVESYVSLDYLYFLLRLKMHFQALSSANLSGALRESSHVLSLPNLTTKHSL